MNFLLSVLRMKGSRFLMLHSDIAGKGTGVGTTSTVTCQTRGETLLSPPELNFLSWASVSQVLESRSTLSNPKLYSQSSGWFSQLNCPHNIPELKCLVFVFIFCAFCVHLSQPFQALFASETALDSQNSWKDLEDGLS